MANSDDLLVDEHDTTSVDSVDLDDDSSPSQAMALSTSTSSSCSSSFCNDELGTPSCNDEDQSNVNFHYIHQDISRNHGSKAPLKRDVISVLQHSSLHVVKSHKRTKLSSNPNIRVSMATLFDELECLKKLIPRNKQGTSLTDPSDIILASLQHLEDTRKQIRELMDRIKVSNPNISLHNLSPASFTRTNHQVEVKRLGEGNAMNIIVNCEKRGDLLSDMMFSIESIGLLLDSMCVSCHDGMFSFKAMASPEVGHTSLIDEEVVKEAILKVILQQ